MRRAIAIVVFFSTALLTLPHVGFGEPSSSCPQSSSCPYGNGRAPAAWYVGAGRIRPAANQETPAKADPTIAKTSAPSATAPTASPPAAPATTVMKVAMNPASESRATDRPATEWGGADCARREEFTAAQLEHLTKAAEHLAAGGFEAEAQKLRSRVDTLRQKQIEQTAAEIERLQAKLVALQGGGSKPLSSPVTTANRPEPVAEPQR